MSSLKYRRLFLQCLEARTVPATFTVTTNADAGLGSLRQAILNANALAGADTINFDMTQVVSPIDLSGGEILVTSSLSILGPGAEQLTVQNSKAASTTSRILNITGFIQSYDFSGMTLTGGNVNGTANGGAIINNSTNSTMTLNGIVLVGNKSTNLGGAIADQSGKLTLNGCTLNGNQALKGGAVWGSGTINDCTFNANQATNGAAVLVSVSLTVNRCSITGNTASGRGGGIYVSKLASLAIQDCTLSGNVGFNGGAVYFYTDGKFTANRSSFAGNSASGRGGAVYFFGKPTAGTNISDCSFANNKGSNHGGALAIVALGQSTNGSPFLIQRSTFSGNSTNGTGGAIYTSFYSLGGAHVSMNNCTISGNSAVNGGGIGVINGSPVDRITIQNSTIAQNSAFTKGGGIARTGGAGIWTIASSIVASNINATTPDVSFNSATNIAGNNDLIGVANAGNFTLTGSAHQTGTLAMPLDPQLSPLADNGGPTLTQMIALTSPAFNAGNNDAKLTTDQRGGGSLRTNGPAPDIGAVEVMINPTALATAGNVTVLGGTVHGVTVTYFDGTAVDVSTLDSADLIITGPNGNLPVAFQSVDSNSNGTPRVATYAFTPPGGTWDYIDNGSYTITMVANEVFDTDLPPNAVAAGAIGTFTVLVPRVFVVDEASDISDGNTSTGHLSLREAVVLANQVKATADTITFDSAVFNGSVTITLVAGEMAISETITIDGTGAPLVTISGNHLSRIFNTQSSPANTEIRFTGLTLINGQSTGIGGAIIAGDESLTLTRCILTANTTTGVGGGGVAMQTGGSLTANDCVFTNNVGGNVGGAIDVFGGNPRTILRRCTLSGNSASNAGAIYAQRYFLMEDCTISSNTATTGIGGGIVLEAPTTTTIQNSSISGNTSGLGGGGFALGVTNYYPFNGTLTLRNSTISNNTALGGSGGGVALVGGTGTIALESTIVSGNNNTNAPDVFSAKNVNAKTSAIGVFTGFTLTDLGGNLLPGTDLQLGPLESNGGFSQTHRLLPGSPCINAGSNPAGLLTDQRGNNRSVGQTDIGAFELQAAPAKVAGVVINGGDAQRSMVTKVQVNFNQHIGFTSTAAAAFTLNQVGGGAVNLAATVDDSGAGTVVTLTFTGGSVNGASLADGRYALHALAAGFNAEGLDGNGDGIVGDDFLFDQPPSPAPGDLNKIFRLFGDANGDGTVTAADFNAFRLVYGTTGSSIFDFDNDGQVSAADFNQFRLRYGVSI